MTEQEDERQRRFLATPVGQPGSGTLRYAAAMHLYQRHSIGADTLEVFRACAPDDTLDPRAELVRLRLTRDLPALYGKVE